jgi:AIPR protein
MATRSIELRVTEDFGRRLKDPSNTSIFHFETYLPFSEAVKLDRGNANVRPPKDNHPFKEMIKSVEDTPELFHLKNRGITYICEKFHCDNQSRKLTITVPKVPKSRLDEESSPRFGIADGGHTFKVVEDVTADMETYRQDEEWIEPFVRVHFMASESDVLGIDDVVEALNTSIQVKRFTLEEYRGKFDELKGALTSTNFDISHVAFRENEDKPWQVTEIIQRLACFLKDRWKIIPPSSMYRSKDKALQLFINDSEGEFKKLYPVIKDLVTFPEFVQSSLSKAASSAKSRVSRSRRSSIGANAPTISPTTGWTAPSCCPWRRPSGRYWPSRAMAISGRSILTRCSRLAQTTCTRSCWVVSAA